MKQLLWVGLGGSIGAMARFKLGGLILHSTANWKFPASTFVVNVSGCLLAGILAGLVEKRDFFTPDARLFLFAGLLGGFTTFSAFGLETVYLLQRHEILYAALNAILSVVIGVLTFWAGIKVIS